MISPRKTRDTNPDRTISPDSSSSVSLISPSPSLSPISASQTVFSCSPSFSPNTDYVVVPVTQSRLVDLLKLERRKRLKLRTAFQREIANSQKTFDVLEKRLDRKVKRMQTKHGQQIWQELLRKIPVLEEQLERCVQRQHKVFQQMTTNRAALQRIESMMRELAQAQQAQAQENQKAPAAALAQENFYCIHVPCTEQTVRMMSEARIDVQAVRFTAETN